MTDDLLRILDRYEVVLHGLFEEEDGSQSGGIRGYLFDFP